MMYENEFWGSLNSNKLTDKHFDSFDFQRLLRVAQTRRRRGALWAMMFHYYHVDCEWICNTSRALYSAHYTVPI